MKVLAQRRGYNGPIELAVEGLGDGVTLEGNTFDGAETLLKITLPADIPAGEIRHATIVGKAKVGEQTVTVPANQREPLMAMFPNALSLPTQLENTIAVGVGPPFPPFFDLSVASPQLYFPAACRRVDVRRQHHQDERSIQRSGVACRRGIARRASRRKLRRSTMA